MNIFEYTDFRSWIRDRVDRTKATLTKFTYAQLAKAMGVQRSYLSQVLSGKNSPSNDQLFLIAEQFDLDDEHREYLLLLNEIDRCFLEKRKKVLIKKRDEMRQRYLVTERYIEERKLAPTQSVEALYQDPFNTLVHVFLTIAEYRILPQKIADLLRIQQKRFNQILMSLENSGVIELTDQGIKVLEKDIHLPKESTFVKNHATFFRMQALDVIQRDHDEKGYYFSSTFSADEETRDHIKLELLQLLARLSKDIRRAPAKNAFQFNIDLFRV